jgi:hypothetical protein
VWLWPGHAAYLGPSLRLDTHSGSVHCLALGVDREFTVHTATGERRARSAFIPARTRHRIAGDGRMLFFYLDPTSATDGLLAAMTDRGQAIAYDHRHEHALAGQDPEHLRRTLVAAPVGDERIRLAMRTLLADPASTRHPHRRPRRLVRRSGWPIRYDSLSIPYDSRKSGRTLGESYALDSESYRIDSEMYRIDTATTLTTRTADSGH